MHAAKQVRPKAALACILDIFTEVLGVQSVTPRPVNIIITMTQLLH